MCIRVEYAPIDTLRPYDAERRVIAVPDSLQGTPLAVKAVRKTLTELAIPQPAFGAVCFCGEPVPLLGRTAQQQTIGRHQVVQRGA